MSKLLTDTERKVTPERKNSLEEDDNNSEISGSAGIGMPLSESENSLSPVKEWRLPPISGQSQSTGHQNIHLSLDEASDPLNQSFSNIPFVGTTKEYRKLYFAKLNKRSQELNDTVLKSVLQVHFSYIPLSTAKKCLSIYWAWIHPIHLTIHRASFIQDMALYSPTNAYKQNCSFSLALLSSIFADTLPLLYGNDNEMAKFVAQHSQSLFTQEMIFLASLATIATALHRSINAMKNNNITQCWIFSGIAYRLAADIDLYNLPEHTEDYISIKNVEARSRLAWALFYWDQNISLYLGRLPIVNQIPFSFDEYITDDTNDNTMWISIIEPKGNKPVSNELMRLIFSGSSTATSVQPLFKRNASGNFKIDCQLAKVKAPLEKSINPHNSTDQQPISNFTESMKLKFRIFEIVNSTLKCLFGENHNILSSASVDPFSPITSHLDDGQIQKLTECLTSLKVLWANSSDNLKVSIKFPPPIRTVVNPTNISNCLQFYSSCVLLYNSLLNSGETDNTQNPAKENLENNFPDSIQLGLECVENIIKILSIYIYYFGDFHIIHWHEYSFFICSRYILSLFYKKKMCDPTTQKQAMSYLQALLKILIKTTFQIPNSVKIVTEIESILSNNSQLIQSQQLATSPIDAPGYQCQQTMHLQPKQLPNTYQQQYPQNIRLQGPIASEMNIQHFMMPPNQSMPPQHHMVPPIQQVSQIAHIPAHVQSQESHHQVSPQQQHSQAQNSVLQPNVYQSHIVNQPIAFPIQAPHHAHNLSGFEIGMLTIDSAPENNSATAYKMTGFSGSTPLTHDGQPNMFPFRPTLISTTPGNSQQGLIASVSAAQFSHPGSSPGIASMQDPRSLNIHPNSGSISAAHPPQISPIQHQPQPMLTTEGHISENPRFTSAYGLTSSASPIRSVIFQSDQHQLGPQIMSSHRHQSSSDPVQPNPQVQPRFTSVHIIQEPPTPTGQN